MRLWVRSLASLSGLRIQRGRELYCRSKTRLGSGVAVAMAVAGSCSSDSNPRLGTSICCGCSPKRQKTKTKTNKKNHMLSFQYLPNKTIIYLIIQKFIPWSFCCGSADQEPNTVPVKMQGFLFACLFVCLFVLRATATTHGISQARG